jgi:hypothetical protein
MAFSHELPQAIESGQGNVDSVIASIIDTDNDFVMSSHKIS